MANMIPEKFVDWRKTIGSSILLMQKIYLFHWKDVIITLCSWTYLSNLHDLLESIKAGEGYSMRDGSFQTGRGAAAWIIEGWDHTNCLLGTCHSPCAVDGHSSFQSELAGIYMTLYTLSLLPPHSNAPTLHLACDRQSVLMCLKRTHITHHRSQWTTCQLALGN